MRAPHTYKIYTQPPYFRREHFKNRGKEMGSDQENRVRRRMGTGQRPVETFKREEVTLGLSTVPTTSLRKCLWLSIYSDSGQELLPLLLLLPLYFPCHPALGWALVLPALKCPLRTEERRLCKKVPVEIGGRKIGLSASSLA